MPYTPSPEFIAALEQIDALKSDQNTPEPVIALGHATKAGLMELAAKQQMLQTAFEAQQHQQPQMQSVQLKAAQTKQDVPASNELIEAAPPPLSVPPGTYEAPRDNAAPSGQVVTSYEPFRGEPSEQQ